MAVQVNPITQSLPATTAIQDPAVRRFAQAVEAALRALRSEEGAVESLKKAADAMNNAVAGGTPPSIAQWLFSSELYQKLTTEIARIDVEAKQNLLDEALARQTAIDEINATLATIQSTAAYDPLVTYAIGDMVTYDGKLYQAILETTGNLPTNTTYWKKVGDYATLGDVVAAHTLEIDDLESRVTTDEGNLTAEIANRQALATQVRGSYTGTDVNLVSQGLIYSERVARATADSNEVAARQSLSAKLLGATSPDGLTLETLSEGLIFDERQARVSGDGANASSISALRAQVGVTEAGALTTGLILDEKNVRASNDLAIVSAVNTALAQITGVSTSISQSGENLIASWTQAQATKWSQIESEVLTSGGQTIRAALLQESQTRANLEGDVYASYTLRVDANGNIAGFGLAADENSSEFIVRADKFAVVTDIGGTPHVPFAIGPSGAEFTGLTSWGNVTGAGRPEDYAATNDANILPDGNFVKQATGQGSYWALKTSGASITSTQGENSTAGLRLNANGEYQYAVQNNFIPARTGDVFFVRARVFVASGSTGTQNIQMPCHDGNKAELPSYPSAGNLRTAVTNGSWQTFEGKITISHAGTQYVRVRPLLELSATAGYLIISDLWVSRTIASQITSSNVTTYIANAALGNAQIGGDIWSNNFVAGSAGWRIYRSGSAEFRNVTARGNIEASSLKANTAMVNRANIVNAAVDTLQIAGNAVTIPVHSRPADVSGIGGTFVSVATVWIDALGSTVSLIASASVRGGSGETAAVAIRILAPNGSAIGGGTGTSVNAAYAHLSCVTSSALAGTYTLQVNKTPGGTSGYATNISLFALGTKR